MIALTVAVFILLFIYYLEYADIELNNTVYLSSIDNLSVKVIDKNLINVTVSSMQDIYTMNTLIFLIKYAKY